MDSKSFAQRSAMSAPRGQDYAGRGHEMRSFADGLDALAFTALAPGLGLGEVRPVVVRKPNPGASVGKAIATPNSLVNEPAPPLRTRSDRSPYRHAKRQTIGAKVHLGFERRCMAWAVDFLFVTSSLALALAIATCVAMTRAGKDFNVLELRPVTWLANFAPYQILFGVYGVFLVYSLLFRLFVGRTFGENLIGQRRQASQQLTPV